MAQHITKKRTGKGKAETLRRREVRKFKYGK